MKLTEQERTFIRQKRFYENSNYKMSFEEFCKCDCEACNKKCIHKDCYRRLPRIDGGLGLCENL